MRKFTNRELELGTERELFKELSIGAIASPIENHPECIKGKTSDEVIQECREKIETNCKELSEERSIKRMLLEMLEDSKAGKW